MSKTAIATNQEEHTAAVQQALSGPQKLMQFLRDTRQEMHKVVTPNRAEVQNTTIIVIITVFMFAAFFELVDLILGNSIDKIFVHLSK